MRGPGGRAEVVSLDIEDVDLEGGAVAIKGKGESERIRLTLPPKTQAALRDCPILTSTRSSTRTFQHDQPRKGLNDFANRGNQELSSPPAFRSPALIRAQIKDGERVDL